MLEKNKVYQGKMEELILQLESESVDVILTDPPYLYLKNQKWDKPFDEQLFFTQAKRVLKKNGFIVLFGRGTSFYRWNTLLSDLGFNFKEEIIWNKSHCTSSLMAMSRVHETVSIHCKGKAGINKVKVPYLEIKKHDINSIIGDIKRMRSVFSNANSLEAVQRFLENNIVPTDNDNVTGTTTSSVIKTQDRCASVMQAVKCGLKEKSTIRTDFVDKTHKYKINESEKVKDGNRCVSVAQSIEYGLNEKTIIKEIRDHYTAIHPTQKPIRLLERILQLVIPKDVDSPLVIDPFAGSASSLIAGVNSGCYVIGFEIDKEYFQAGNKRLQAHLEAKKKEVIQ